MFLWFASLTTVQQVYAAIAVPATVCLVLQTLLLLFGIGSVPPTAEDGAVQELERFSLHSVLAMLTLGAWSGLLLSELGVSLYVTVPISVLVGVGGLLFAAHLMGRIKGQREDEALSLAQVIGMEGVVFLPVPDYGKGEGKVLFRAEEGVLELAAVTEDRRTLQTGASVIATAIDPWGRLVVTEKAPEA